jgi:transposase
VDVLFIVAVFAHSSTLVLGCPFDAMPVVSEMVHPSGLDFNNQRKVVILRDKTLPGGKKLAFKKIAKKVRNLMGKPTTEGMTRRVYSNFNSKKGRVQSNYHKCGRSPWKLTKEVGAFLVRRLLAKRRSSICTSSTLQAEIFKELHVKISCSAISKHLKERGYKWLPRAQKRKYSKEAMRKRLRFAKHIAKMSQKKIDEHVTFATDGVILTVPPDDELGRQNYCMHGVTHMYRKETEAAAPSLAGDDPYAGQVPLSRAIPLWGAISSNGFHEIVYHTKKKLSDKEWKDAVQEGKLMVAVRKLQPGRHVGPRRVLCDNESFLSAKLIRPLYARRNVRLMHIPAYSPDLNPIESFWGWLRGELRRRDLEDLRLKKPALNKIQYTQRIKKVLRTVKAQNVAKAKFRNFKRVCQEVVEKKGAMSRQ